MTRYELYLGRSTRKGAPIPRAAVLDFLARTGLEAYTVFDAQGYWRGTPEESTVLVVLGDADQKPALARIARDYADAFDQESVFATESPVTGTLIEGSGSAARAA